MGSILVDFERKLEKQQYVSLALFNRTAPIPPQYPQLLSARFLSRGIR